MFNLGFSELILLFVIGLVILGPKQLPQVAKVLGRLAGEVKKAMSDVTSEMERASKVVKQESDNLNKSINDSLNPSTDKNLIKDDKEEDGRA